MYVPEPLPLKQVKLQAVLLPVGQTADDQAAGSQTGHVSGNDSRVGVGGNPQKQAQLAGPDHLVNQPGGPGDKKTNIDDWL